MGSRPSQIRATVIRCQPGIPSSAVLRQYLEDLVLQMSWNAFSELVTIGCGSSYSDVQHQSMKSAFKRKFKILITSYEMGKDTYDNKAPCLHCKR